jgi:formylmethanofuran dehydrogenase subunit E
MQVLDHDKLAATFVDTQTRGAIRITPHPGCRENAQQRLPDSQDRWQAQLEAYQILPDEQLLVVEPVQLAVSLKAIISQPGMLAICKRCCEEISNQREVFQNGQILCQT